jgi:hypothetical protein
MVGSRILVLLLVGSLIALTPLAHSSPPDQTWISGIYDGDDFDDVVVSITSTASTVDPAPLDGIEPGQIALGAVPPVEAYDDSRPAPPAFLGRAPPLA